MPVFACDLSSSEMWVEPGGGRSSEVKSNSYFDVDSEIAKKDRKLH